MTGLIWTAGTFLAKTRELERRLRSWHIEDFRSPIQFVSLRESRRWVRLTFREIVTNSANDPGPRPVGWQVYAHEDGEPDEEGYVGEIYQNPDRDTDRSLTMWLMGDFQRHLQVAPPLPAVDHLKLTFGHILDRPAWTVCDPANVWSRSMASYSRDAHGDERCYMVTGRKVSADLLTGLTEAASKLLSAAPTDWRAITKPAPDNDSTWGTTEETKDDAASGQADDQDEGKELRDTLAWLKRVTPEWPPMGIDWPLVLSKAEKWYGQAEPDPTVAQRLAEGRDLADVLRESLDTETIRQIDTFSRGYALASLMLDAFAVLEAICKASLAMGYDLDAIERPVKQLPPFHALMVLGWPILELIRCARDLSKPDVDAITEPAPRPVKVGAAYGCNAHQAIWHLADEICRLSDSVTEGRLSRRHFGKEPQGSTEYAWATLSRTLEDRFPCAIEAKQLRVLLETESRVAFDRTQSKTNAVHNADFTMVVWYGTEYSFALGVQSSSVGVLWEEWEKSGLGLHQETIRESIDAERDNFRMDTAFRNHPAWGTMIHRCGDGRYQLAPPASQPSPSVAEAKKTAKSAPKSRRKRA
jgi:hypothetical protein